MAVVPGALRRVARNRARLIAVSLLALVSIAAAGINVTAADRLQSLLDENWRGAYDILVTADGSEVAGLLAPNSLAAGAEAMTLDDLARVRSVIGVEVAAPIGEVLVPALATRHAEITIPKGAAGANEVPQAFRVTLTQGTDDGLGDRVVSTEIFDIVIDETKRPAPVRPPTSSCSYDGHEVNAQDYPLLMENCGAPFPELLVSHVTGSGWHSSGEVQGDAILFTLGNAVLPSTRITLVDPAAERALLGAAGDFLAPLQELEGDVESSGDVIAAWAESADDEFSRKFQTQQAALAGISSPYTPELIEELTRLYEANGATYETGVSAGNYVPMVVRETGPAPFAVSIQVEAFGPAPRIDAQHGVLPYRMPEGLASGKGGTRLGASYVDASSMLNPFSDENVLLPWPGTSADGVEGMPWFSAMSIYAAGTASAPHFEVVREDTDRVEVRLPSSGYVYPLYTSPMNGTEFVSIESDGTKPGMESVFAAEVETRALMLPYGLSAVAVGRFSTDGIDRLQTELSHVPLGAYGAVGSTMIPGSPGASGAYELKPSVSGLGLVSSETVAIAPISSAESWGEKAPINAVRVRVAGVDSYGPSGISKIASVAEQLAELGFTATVVAGSSPTDVIVHVDDYAFGVGGTHEKQRIGPLGAVNQRWSELGVASRVDLAVSVSSLGVLAVALAASALLLAAVQLASVPGRRAQASVMHIVGWGRTRTIRWMAAEELVSLGVLVAAGAVALLLAGWRPTVTMAVGASLAALVLTSVLAVALGARSGTDRNRLVRRGTRRHRESELDAWVTSSLRFSVRQLSVHRTGALVQLLATVVVAISSAAVAVTILEGRASAGASALGDFASAQAFVSQVGLGVVGLVAGIILAVIARRIDLGARQEQWSAMRAMGFSSGQLRLVQLSEGLLVAAPSIGVATAATWFYAEAVALHLRPVSLPVGLGAAVVLTVILVLTSWREKK